MKSIVIVILAMTLINCNNTDKSQKKTETLYVGTYTNEASEGIYRLQFDSETGVITNSELAAKIASPSYLVISPEKDFLYAVQEINDFENDTGAVTAFSIKNNNLTALQTVTSGGAHPCHVSLSPSGDRLAVSNYTGGNASIYKIAADGTLIKPSTLIDHMKIDSTKAAHTHMAQWVNDAVYITDLGLDMLISYKENDTDLAKFKSINRLPEGAGPRHFTTSENGKFLYVINELNSTITVFEKKDLGNYVKIQNESTLASDYKGDNACADIHISKDGKFLYGSNRGENTIVIFSIEENTGKLTLIGRESVHGDWPRNFTMDPSGKFLLVANKKTNNITVFKRDIEKGTLTFLNEEKVSQPVCLLFL